MIGRRGTRLGEKGLGFISGKNEKIKKAKNGM